MSTAQHISRVLVADENEVTRRAFRAALEAEGYEVLDSSDGIDALTILCLSNDALVVVVGAHLPDMEAEDMLNIVAQDAQLRSRHAFIVLADYDGDPSPALARYLAHLAIPVLAKPLDRSTLVEAVASAVAQLRVIPLTPLLHR
jgi:CheY-like chemotaxis protein